jgi:hypothetical protein
VILCRAPADPVGMIAIARGKARGRQRGGHFQQQRQVGQQPSLPMACSAQIRIRKAPAPP